MAALARKALALLGLQEYEFLGSRRERLNLSLLSGQTYLLEMYLNTSAVVPSGAIGIRLLDAPSGLNTASLFQNVTFSNVALSEVPEPACMRWSA